METFKDVKIDSGVKAGKFISIGPNELKITNLTTADSKDGLKKQITIHFESKPILEDGFEGFEGALGKIGKSKLGIYTSGIKGEKAWEEIKSIFATIADSLGILEELKTMDFNGIDDLLPKFLKIAKNKYCWWMICGEEYLDEKAEGGPKVKYFITLPRYSYVAPTEAELLAKMKGKVWPTKEGTPWFFKKLVKMDKDTSVADDFNTDDKPKDDLPF